ncbi:MAG TPA: phosphopantetheine-binding protein [Actinomycetota bacterium]|nr:phosphopantetheine-binding protein [Actinomycetota bacterium]
MTEAAAYAAPVREFVSRAFKGRVPADDEDIFASGVVNSLFAMELVTFVESTFDLTIDSDDLDLENFSSVDAIARLVARKKRAPAAASS